MCQRAVKTGQLGQLKTGHIEETSVCRLGSPKKGDPDGKSTQYGQETRHLQAI